MSTVTCQHCAFEVPSERTYCPQCKKRLRAAGTAATPKPTAPVAAFAPPQSAPTPRAESGLPTPRADFEARVQKIAANAAPYAPVTVRPQVTRKVRPVLAGLTIAGLIGIAGVLIWLLLAHAHRADVAHRMLVDRQSTNLAVAAQADDDVIHAARTYLALLVVTAALFIAWLFHLTKVIQEYSPNALRHGPGWAIGGWFVPILNLVRPKQMVDDVWSGSSTDWSQKGPAFYVHLWWAVFLISGVVDRISAAYGTDTLGQIESADRFARWADGFELVAVALAILVVATTTRRVLHAVRPA